MKLLTTVFVMIACAFAFAGEEKLEFGRFGEVTLYSEAPRPARVAILISGEDGWSDRAVAMARNLESQDTLVIGVDVNRYLRKLNASTARAICRL